MKRFMSKYYKLNETDDSEMTHGFSEELLDELVELVGSEEEVEAAAEEAHNDLIEAFERNEVEVNEDDVPENLAMAALVIKLVQKGQLSAEDADGLIEKHL